MYNVYYRYPNISEGLPRGIILPQDCIEDKNSVNEEVEEYFSAEEEAIESTVRFRNVATQTESAAKEVSLCMIM